MILQAHNNIVSDMTAWDVSVLSGLSPLLVSDTLQAGYTDISSITGWGDYGTKASVDIVVVKREIKALYDATTWASLSTAEKLICCAYIVGTHAERVATIGLDNVILYGLAYHAKAVEARQTRTAYAVAEVHNRLPNNYQEVVDDLINGNLFLTYVQFGREGTAQGDPEAITDYLNGTTGTTWAGAGLLQKGWTPEGLADMQALVDRIEAILIDGVY